MSQEESQTFDVPGYLLRDAEKDVLLRLRRSPVVALVGPRRCGEATLAKKALSHLPRSLHVDLERPSDAAKLTDPEAFCALHAGGTVCLDEIQRVPDLFPVLRSVVDAQARNGLVLVLGSASPGLLRQSSETLAGRVTLLELTPFLLPELAGARDRRGPGHSADRFGVPPRIRRRGRAASRLPRARAAPLRERSPARRTKGS